MLIISPQKPSLFKLCSIITTLESFEDCIVSTLRYVGFACQPSGCQPSGSDFERSEVNAAESLAGPININSMIVLRVTHDSPADAEQVLLIWDV